MNQRTQATSWTAIFVVAGLSVGCDRTPEPTGSNPAASTVVSADPNGSDEAYCDLFARRTLQCMPNTTKGTHAEESSRCLGGRTSARLIGKWDEEKRRVLVGCLKNDDCDAIDACMGKIPSERDPAATGER